MYDNYQGDPNQEVMSVGSWLITLLILAIPCVNIVMYFIWAFGNGNENRKNFCRAGLIFMLIAVVLSVLLSSMFGAALFMANF
ncbi:MAG TPA: hypothetical protein H9704_06765 [Candidatus Enterocloster excrementipullorum]|uniref:Uncharacterized protein n=1 Tax=Candidatus Enterocloster excrementipullorum TaxID=2838559 RepID=A0A9D2SH01_9FIRM|nr:hypothetical protein [Candidatus Enterocloster excrementipullorum]